MSIVSVAPASCPLNAWAAEQCNSWQDRCNNNSWCSKIHRTLLCFSLLNVNWVLKQSLCQPSGSWMTYILPTFKCTLNFKIVIHPKPDKMRPDWAPVISPSTWPLGLKKDAVTVTDSISEWHKVLLLFSRIDFFKRLLLWLLQRLWIKLWI